MDPVTAVAEALEGTGLNLFGSSSIADYDKRAPAGFRSADLMPRALGVVVVGSAGRELWARVRGSLGQEDWSGAHPLDTYVARLLDRADVALAHAGIGSRRFEPTVYASPLVDFRALGELAGLGSMGPFGLLIHETHGPWWAMRGAWLVDAPVPPSHAPRPPCAGCAAPCLGGARRPEGILLATPSVRARCPVGADSRYTDEQVAYHYDREATLESLRGARA
jgi:epoxyqueuosine reductase QueG